MKLFEFMEVKENNPTEIISITQLGINVLEKLQNNGQTY